MSPGQNAAGSFGPFKDDALEEDLPSDCELLHAPRMRCIPLPEEEEDYGEDVFYGGSDLGGWLTGELDGVPKTMLLSGLDVDLPVPFTVEN